MKTTFLASVFLILFSSSALPAEFVVTSASSSVNVPGSLPWALDQAYNNSENDTILFDLPYTFSDISGPAEIIRLSQQGDKLCRVGDADGVSSTVIDGTSQPNYPETKVEIHGGKFVFEGRGSTIKGVILHLFNGTGITLQGDGEHNITDCTIGQGTEYITFWVGGVGHGYYQGWYGTNNNETYPESTGIRVLAPSCTISGNLITGCGSGIIVGESPLESSTAMSNYWMAHSTYIASNEVISNRQSGILLGNGATYCHIAYNTIWYNIHIGLEVIGKSGVVNYVYGNSLGQNAAGILLGNSTQGNAIGKWVANSIYWNDYVGIAIGFSDASGAVSGDSHYNDVSYNFIEGDVQNWQQLYGIAIQGNSWLNAVYGNVVQSHLSHGIYVGYSHVNYIFQNGIATSTFPNWGYGVFLEGSWYNRVYWNYYGRVNMGSNANYKDPTHCHS